MGILQFIASRNYITVNRDLIKIVGLEGAVVLGELASEYDYYFNKEELEDGYFYSTIENIENNTGLSEHRQRKVMNTLKEQEILDIKLSGMPARRYIKINEEQLSKLLDAQFLKNQGTSSEKIKEQVLKKLKGNNNIINKNKNKYNIYGEFRRVKLTDEEYKRLVDEFGETFIKNQIDELDRYVESNNNKNGYTNFNLVLRKSIREGWFRKRENNIPEWFGKEYKAEEISKDEENEIENILKEIGEWIKWKNI